MRLYFHVRERGHFSEDDEGAEFATVEDALREAMLAARELLAERIVAGKPINGIAFEILDEHGRVRLVFPWDEALVRA